MSNIITYINEFIHDKRQPHDFTPILDLDHNLQTKVLQLLFDYIHNNCDFCGICSFIFSGIVWDNSVLQTHYNKIYSMSTIECKPFFARYHDAIIMSKANFSSIETHNLKLFHAKCLQSNFQKNFDKLFLYNNHATDTLQKIDLEYEPYSHENFKIFKEIIYELQH